MIVGAPAAAWILIAYAELCFVYIADSGTRGSPWRSS